MMWMVGDTVTGNEKVPLVDGSGLSVGLSDPKGKARELFDTLGKPRSLKEICRLLSIEVKRVGFDSKKAGTVALLVPVPRGYILAIAREVQLTPRAMDLILGHEIGHTLFYDRHGTGSPTRTRPITVEEERFCDAFAEALLEIVCEQETKAHRRKRTGRGS